MRSASHDIDISYMPVKHRNRTILSVHPRLRQSNSVRDAMHLVPVQGIWDGVTRLNLSIVQWDSDCKQKTVSLDRENGRIHCANGVKTLSHFLLREWAHGGPILLTPSPRGDHWEREGVIEIDWLTSQSTIYQPYMWRYIDMQADWRSWTYGRATNAIDIS